MKAWRWIRLLPVKAQRAGRTGQAVKPERSRNGVTAPRRWCIWVVMSNPNRLPISQMASARPPQPVAENLQGHDAVLFGKARFPGGNLILSVTYRNLVAKGYHDPHVSGEYCQQGDAA